MAADLPPHKSPRKKPLDLCQAEKTCSSKHAGVLSAEQKYSYLTEWEQREPPGGEKIAGFNLIVVEVLKGTNKMSRMSIEGPGWDGSNWVWSETERCGREWKWQHGESFCFCVSSFFSSLLFFFPIQPGMDGRHVTRRRDETLAKLLKIKCTRLATKIQSAPGLRHFVKLMMPGNLWQSN